MRFQSSSFAGMEPPKKRQRKMAPPPLTEAEREAGRKADAEALRAMIAAKRALEEAQRNMRALMGAAADPASKIESPPFQYPRTEIHPDDSKEIDSEED